MAEPQAARKPGTSSWQWGRTAQTQRALLDAARDVFTQQGFAEASIADVVERAGSSVGSLYHHFGGKSELFLALWHEHQQAYEAAASAAVAAARQRGVSDPAELFAAGARAFLEGSWQRRDLAMLFSGRRRPARFRGDEATPRARVDQPERRPARLTGHLARPALRGGADPLIGEGAREVAAARTRIQAAQIIDAVIEYAQRVMAGGPAGSPDRTGQVCARQQ